MDRASHAPRTFATRPAAARRLTAPEKRVVFATSLGTAFEWYDFYLFVALAPIVARHFFDPLPPAQRTLFVLLAFVAAFAVRPLGALLFGRLADRAGRKRTLVATTTLMGAATLAVGLLPTHAEWGLAAPIALVALRVLQGLAIGGEYGCAAAYVAEHAPAERRGLCTGWLQATASAGLLIALLVMLGVREALGERGFAEWGWRVPCMASIALLVVSLWTRLRLRESPVFERLARDGGAAAHPVATAFGTASGLRRALLALAGVTAGQAVVWYSAQLYALDVLRTAGLDPTTAGLLMACALALALPTFVAFGALADRIGRKPLVVGGCLAAALAWFPLFGGLVHFANSPLAAAQARVPIVVSADPADCALLFDPAGVKVLDSSCDIARKALTDAGLHYTRVAAMPGSGASVTIGATRLSVVLGDEAGTPGAVARFVGDLDGALIAHGFPRHANPDEVDRPMLVLLLTALVVIAAAVYAPVAAILAELFPTRVRCTSAALPYHVGNGWFGGFLPATATALAAAGGDPLAGLWYPVAVALATGAIAARFLPETRGRDLARID